MSTRPARRRRARIVVLGGGAMGRIAAGDLERSSRGKVQVVVADRDPAPARALGLEAVPVDVDDGKSLRGVLDGAFATIAALPYRFNLAAMQGALEAGAHYVDLGGLFHMTRRQLELGRDFERRGLMAILGMGSAPGILNVMAVLAARALDVVSEIHCLVGAADRTRFQTAPPLGFGYSVDTLLDEFALPAAVFRDGEFTMVPPLDRRERVEVRFPPPIGRIQVDTTLHSEVATLPLSFADRGVREVTFRQGFEQEFLERLEFLVRLGFADTSPLRAGAAGLTPRQVLLQLLARFPPAKTIGKPDRHEVLRTVVRGKRGRHARTVTVDCHAGPRAGGGIGPDIDTGAPPSIALQLMLDGELKLRPGVWAPEQVVPVEPFVRELKRRGMRVTRRTHAGLRTIRGR